MRNFLVVASAVMAGIVLTPQARAAQAGAPARQITADTTGDQAARIAARNLRQHGFWGFGKARMRDGDLYLQAYRGRGTPVMIKISLNSGRVMALKTFRQRHARTGIAIEAFGPFAASPGSKRAIRQRG